MSKNHPVAIRLSEEEKKKIEKKSKILGMKFSECIRFLALNSDIEVKVNQKSKMYYKSDTTFLNEIYNNNI